MPSEVLEERLTASVRDMVLGSPRLTGFAGDSAAVDRMLDAIENVWIDSVGLRIHVDLHPSDEPKAVIVFHPGSGAHARLYFLLGGLLARLGYCVLAIDRPGHGLSEGARGDCTVEEAIAVADTAMGYARARWPDQPVVLMGSSMGGLLAMFGLIRGSTPDLAIAHNFLYPGKLLSMRLRAKWIARRRAKPYPLVKVVHRFERLSDDPSIRAYLQRRDDPGAAWELSARSMASLFGFRAQAPPMSPPALVLTGDRDKAIPAWATRLFTKWSGLRNTEVKVLPETGHLLFHDHLDRSVPLVAGWLDARLGSVA